MRISQRLTVQAGIFGFATWLFSLAFSGKTDIMSGDARLTATLADYQMSQFGKSVSLRSDFLFGIGGLQGGYQFWLDPVSIIGSIGSGIYNQYLVAIFAAVSIFVLTSKLLENLGVKRTLSRISAALTGIATVWGYAIALVDSELFGHVPQYGSLLIASLAVLFSFTQIGGDDLRNDLTCALIFLFLVCYLFVALPHLVVTSVPLLLIFGGATLINDLRMQSTFALRNKIVSVVVSFAVLLLLKAPAFVYGFYKNTAATELPINTFKQPELTPILRFIFETYFPTPSASGNYVFQFVCFAIITIYLLSGVFKSSRRDQIWFVTLLAAIFLLLYRLWQTTWVFESGPRINYFVWLFAPLYAVAVTKVTTDFFSILKQNKKFSSIIAKRNISVLLILVICLGMYFSPLTSLRFSRQEPLEPSLNELKTASVFTKSISFQGDSIYKGRAAFLLGPFKYPEQITNRIPLLNDYSHNLTPHLYSFYERFLLAKDEFQARNNFIFDARNFEIYRMLGVRYVVIENQDLPKIIDEKRLLSKVAENSLNSTFEISRPNIGNFSPTRIRVEESFQKTLDLIKSGDFSPDTDVILDEPVNFNLVPAQSTELRIKNGDLFLTANSPGASMVLLPFEYSSCLKVESLNGSKGLIKIARADGVLTAVLFENETDVVIKLRFGLFENQNCRSADLKIFQGS